MAEKKEGTIQNDYHYRVSLKRMRWLSTSERWIWHEVMWLLAQPISALGGRVRLPDIDRETGRHEQGERT